MTDRDKLRSLDNMNVQAELETERKAWELRKATKWLQTLACHAAIHSKDPSTKTAAAIVTPDRFRQVSIGYNGMPFGTDENDGIWADRIRKYGKVVHAEANALDFAYSDVSGMYMVCLVFPCHVCAGRIVARGIKKVFHTTIPRPSGTTDASGQPLFDLNTQDALSTLRDGGVELVRVPGFFKLVSPLEFAPAPWDPEYT